MIFKVKQTVAHRDYPVGFVKECHIIGMDLPHAITMINCDHQMKEDLRKNYRATKTDDRGRVVTIEITEEVKS